MNKKAKKEPETSNKTSIEVQSCYRIILDYQNYM